MSINIRQILASKGQRFGYLYDNKPEFKEAIKEIVEQVVDLCAKNATAPLSTRVNKDSILKVKKLIQY